MRHAARRPTLRSLLGLAGTLLLVAGWLLFLHPQSLYGRAAYVVVSGESMEPTMYTGDLVVVNRQDSYETGDVVVYAVPAGEVGAGQLIVHRIVGGSGEAGFVIRGDNRDTADQWKPTAGELIGKQLVHVPAAGRWLGVVRSPLVVGTTVAVIAMMAVASSGGTSTSGDGPSRPKAKGRRPKHGGG